ISSKDFFIHEYETQPIDGFASPEGFPNCCAYHKGLYQSAKATLDNFPMCCEAHRRLIDQPWFDKLNYAYVPDKVLNTVAYTDHCIQACINTEVWFKEITAYISVTVDSYGQFPHDFGPPLGLSL